MTDAKSDMVNHPPHYNNHPSGIECIQITRHMNFNIGNAIKYLWRAGLKQDFKPITESNAPSSSVSWTTAKHIEDLKKAVWYINDEIGRLEKLK